MKKEITLIKDTEVSWRNYERICWVKSKYI